MSLTSKDQKFLAGKRLGGIDQRVKERIEQPLKPFKARAPDAPRNPKPAPPKSTQPPRPKPAPPGPTPYDAFYAICRPTTEE